MNNIDPANISPAYNMAGTRGVGVYNVYMAISYTQ